MPPQLRSHPPQPRRGFAMLRTSLRQVRLEVDPSACVMRSPPLPLPLARLIVIARRSVPSAIARRILRNRATETHCPLRQRRMDARKRGMERMDSVVVIAAIVVTAPPERPQLLLHHRRRS